MLNYYLFKKYFEYFKKYSKYSFPNTQVCQSYLGRYIDIIHHNANAEVDKTISKIIKCSYFRYIIFVVLVFTLCSINVLKFYRQTDVVALVVGRDINIVLGKILFISISFDSSYSLRL